MDPTEMKKKRRRIIVSITCKQRNPVSGDNGQRSCGINNVAEKESGTYKKLAFIENKYGHVGGTRR